MSVDKEQEKIKKRLMRVLGLDLLGFVLTSFSVKLGERMNRETFSLFWLLFLLLAAGYTPTISAQVLVTISNIDQLIVATIGEPDSVDPAWTYDTASAELIFNVYETLIRFDYEKVDEFLPCLATEWTIEDISETSPEGLTWLQRYTFKIREDVRFHDGSLLTTEDTEYSFERAMVQDRQGGPTGCSTSLCSVSTGLISRIPCGVKK